MYVNAPLPRLRAVQDFLVIVRALSKRLNDNGEGNENWRQIYKTMLVIEFLVAQGNERCPSELKEVRGEGVRTGDCLLIGP